MFPPGPPMALLAGPEVGMEPLCACAAVGGGAVVYATTSSGDSSATAAGPGGQNGQPPGGMGMGGMGAAGDLASALHGEYVVSDGDGDGGYTTELLQVGTVTAINSTSLTAESEDGYTQTYTIDSDTAVDDDIATGDTVTVVATDSGDTATAASLTEGSQQAGPGGTQSDQGVPPRREDDDSSGSGN